MALARYSDAVFLTRYPVISRWLLVGAGLCLWMAIGTASAQDLESALAAPPNDGQATELVADQQADAAPPITLSSPRQTMQTFVDAMNQVKAAWIPGEQAYESALSAMDFGSLTDIDRRERANQLYTVLNRIEYIDYDAIDKDVSEPDEQAGAYLYFPAPTWDVTHRLFGRTAEIVRSMGKRSVSDLPGGIELVRSEEDGAWRFSIKTVNDIPLIYEQMVNLPMVEGVTDLDADPEALIESWLPPQLVNETALGIKYWQWLAILLVIFVGLGLDLFVRAVLRVIAHRIAGKEFVDHDEGGLRRALRPLGLLAASIFWLLTIHVLGLEGLALAILNGSLTVFATFAGVVSGWRLIDLASGFLMFKASRTATRVDDVLVPLLRKSLKIFVVVFGLVFAARALDIDIWPLVASLGLGSVAFAFAAKDTVENFFGSIAVLLDRPFHVGDWVVIEGNEGIVEEVGFRSTRIRTFYNSQITIPNANLVRAAVDNYGRRRYRRWKTVLGVQYDTSPEQLAAFTEGIRELIRLHPYTRKDYYQVYCNEFGESALQILLYMFFEVPDWNTELRERDRLFRDIVRLADAVGVQFAFPTQTVHLFKEEHAPARRRHDDPELLTDRRASVWGIRAAKGVTRHQDYIHTKPDPVEIQSDVSDDGQIEELDDAGNPIEQPHDDVSNPSGPFGEDDRPHEHKGGG